MATALLFDRHAVEEVEDWEGSLPRIRRSSVLWIDLERPEEPDLDGLMRSLGLSAETVKALADLIASTGQQTNDIMKVLTLASVVILPGTLIAGVMGLNFRLGLFDNNAVFWIMIAAMLAIALVTLAAARVRDWI